MERGFTLIEQIFTDRDFLELKIKEKELFPRNSRKEIREDPPNKTADTKNVDFLGLEIKSNSEF